MPKPIECTKPRVNPNVNYRLEVIMICNVGSLIVTKAPLQCQMLLVGEVVYMWGQREYMNSLYFLLNFAVNLKLLLKIKSVKKKKKRPDPMRILTTGQKDFSPGSSRHGTIYVCPLCIAFYPNINSPT